MKKDLEMQKKEIRKLHQKYEEYLNREFANKNYLDYLSNPDNFTDGVFYHQANSEKEKFNIIKNGFDKTMVQKSNCGVGRGLYLGRDKKVLINFYTTDCRHSKDFIVEIRGKFNFLDLLDDREFFQKNKNKIENKTLGMGYDGIRYYDPDATGEEFVLFNIKKAKIWNT